MRAYVQQKTWTRIIKAVLLVIVNNGQKVKFLTWYSRTMENQTAIKKELLLQATRLSCTGTDE